MLKIGHHKWIIFISTHLFQVIVLHFSWLLSTNNWLVCCNWVHKPLNYVLDQVVVEKLTLNLNLTTILINFWLILKAISMRCLLMQPDSTWTQVDNISSKLFEECSWFRTAIWVQIFSKISSPSPSSTWIQLKQISRSTVWAASTRARLRVDRRCWKDWRSWLRCGNRWRRRE